MGLLGFLQFKEWETQDGGASKGTSCSMTEGKVKQADTQEVEVRPPRDQYFCQPEAQCGCGFHPQS